jgi:CubicO group peptidase (beta-lactamase class C family)
MNTQSNSPTNKQHRMRTGLISSISILVVILAIFVFVPRLLPKGPYQKPINTGDGWETASLSQVGMDKQPIIDMLNLLASQKDNAIQGIVVVKDGKLVLETYYPGSDLSVTDQLSFTQENFGQDTLHCLASATKSVTSILFGIAYDQGKLPDLDEKMFASFPDYADLNSGDRAEITLRQMLTMTSGIPWDESASYNDPVNDLGNMAFFAPDPIRYVLAKPLNAKPGEVWQYNSGTTNLLGEIIKRKTGMALPDYAQENLFKPLGITNSKWQAFPTDTQLTAASSLLYLRPRDMAKIGQLYLQLGLWNGAQVVSPQWIQKSTAISVQPSTDLGTDLTITGYGYQWWRGRFANGNTDTFFAAGFGGQFIFIIPTINTVVVTTGSSYQGNYDQFFELINQDILASIYGSK